MESQAEHNYIRLRVEDQRVFKTTLSMLLMLREMFRMLMGAQQTKKTKLTPIRMLFVLLLLAIFLIIRILFDLLAAGMIGKDLQTL